MPDDHTPDSPEYRKWQASLNAFEMWEALSQEERREIVLNTYTAPQWFEDPGLPTLAPYRLDEIQWGRIKARGKEIGVNGWDLDKAADAWLRDHPESDARHIDQLIESTRFPFVAQAPTAPALPPRAYCTPPGLDTWLHRYAAHSAYWAPRAAPGYHMAVGLWVLSTVAARRIVIPMGSNDVFPTLFIALVSESTLWTKTTAAALGVRLIRRAGCGHLLGPDRTTPQFLLKLMSGIVPQDYSQKNEDEQAAMRRAYGFSAQRGWFYEEWGGMLHQMRRSDSPQAELNKLLIVLEGGASSFETGTIQRGLERIHAPYLALLANATPHDLTPFMEEGDAWWHTGFWPRFVCITPQAGEHPVHTVLPREAYQVPHELLFPLHDWHERLGSPEVTIEERKEASGKRTGQWVGTIAHFPRHEMRLDRGAYDAYETYNDALLEVMQGGNLHEDLRPWYGRAHEKALRVAMLLASVEGDDVVTLPYWQEAQSIVEGWRANLHTLVGTIGTEGQQTPQGKRRSRLEKKVESLLSLSGGMTARELQRHLKGVSSDELQSILQSMVKMDMVRTVKTGKRLVYFIFSEDGAHDDD